jgi:ribosome biogenesis GTPase
VVGKDAALEALGWDERHAASLTDEERRGLPVARVVEQHKGYYVVDDGAPGAPRLAQIAGRLRHAALVASDLPAVGDWVVTSPRPGERARIERVLPRRTRLARKAAGEAPEEQILCANVDVALAVEGLDREPSPRRVERYLALIRGGGVRPAVALTKADLCGDVAAATAPIRAVAGDAPVLAVSAPRGEGVDAVAALIPARRTAVLLGPSGAGKSTLLNALAGGEIRAVGDVRPSDRKGRHVTTARTLVRLPGGGLVIDSPGIRELEIWDAGAALEDTFEDVDAVAASCRFGDCSHLVEPGCAVRAALEAGTLDPARLEAYTKLRDEQAARSARGERGGRGERGARAERTRREKAAARALRARLRGKG